jgi:hypothetical protein
MFGRNGFKKLTPEVPKWVFALHLSFQRNGCLLLLTVLKKYKGASKEKSQKVLKTQTLTSSLCMFWQDQIAQPNLQASLKGTLKIFMQMPKANNQPLDKHFQYLVIPIIVCLKKCIIFWANAFCYSFFSFIEKM